MPSERAARRWESCYGPQTGRAPCRARNVNMLTMAEDDATGHPLSPAGLVLPIPPGSGSGRYQVFVDRIAQFCREHRIHIVNHGPSKGHGIAVNFRNTFHAAKFKLLWTGWAESGTGYSVRARARGGNPFAHPIEVVFTLDAKPAMEVANAYRRLSGEENVAILPVTIATPDDWW